MAKEILTFKTNSVERTVIDIEFDTDNGWPDKTLKITQEYPDREYNKRAVCEVSLDKAKLLSIIGFLSSKLEYFT
jgi:hypothetical protein